MIKQEITKPDCAWTAGIIDGEGSIIPEVKRAKNKPRPNIKIQVRMCDKKAIKKLGKLWDGNTNMEGVTDCNNKIWKWVIYKKDIRQFIENIKPYSVTKKKHLELAARLRERIEEKKGMTTVKRGGHVSMWIPKEELLKRMKIRNQISKMNRSGAIPKKNYMQDIIDCYEEVE